MLAIWEFQIPRRKREPGGTCGCSAGRFLEPRNMGSKKSSTLEETPVGPFGMLMLICRGDVSGSLAS